MTIPALTAEIGFFGSYEPADVTFLLRRIDLAPTPTAEKEHLIQSGKRHYSEMVAEEPPPTAEYLALYRAAMDRNVARLGRDVAALATHPITRARVHGRPEIVLVSLARAGTPIGVAMRRAVVRRGIPCTHYSISIIRDRGIDAAALDLILARHEAQDVYFIDGWTGKGAIAAELREALIAYNAARGATFSLRRLLVVSDLAGVAAPATTDDYLIPSAVLNAVVSGLISRTVLTPALAADGGLHGAVVYEDLRPHDVSREFVDELDVHVATAQAEDPNDMAMMPYGVDLQRVARASAAALDALVAECCLADRHRIKPGLAEATRALLRRVPDRLLLRNPGSADVAHLRLLAAQAGVTPERRPDLPFQAVAVIKSVGRESHPKSPTPP